MIPVSLVDNEIDGIRSLDGSRDQVLRFESHIVTFTLIGFPPEIAMADNSRRCFSSTSFYCDVPGIDCKASQLIDFFSCEIELLWNP